MPAPSAQRARQSAGPPPRLVARVAGPMRRHWPPPAAAADVAEPRREHERSRGSGRSGREPRGRGVRRRWPVGEPLPPCTGWHHRPDMSGPTILVVDDEPPIIDLVRGYLEREGYAVHAAARRAVGRRGGPRPGAGRRHPRRDAPGLRRRRGVPAHPRVLRRVRPHAHGAERGDRPRRGPVRRRRRLPDEAVQPARARRARQGAPPPTAGAPDDGRRRAADGGTAVPAGLAVDVPRRTATVDGRRVALTTTEFEILAALARDPGVVVSRQALLDAVWGVDFVGDDHLVDVHVANLRRKLGDDADAPRFVETVRGVGYRLVEPRDPPPAIPPDAAPPREPRRRRRGARDGARRREPRGAGLLRRGDGPRPGRPAGVPDGRRHPRRVPRGDPDGARRRRPRGGRRRARRVDRRSPTRIAGPVSRLAAAARRIAGGHYAERVPASGVGEIGDLATAFNVMTASLEETERRTAPARRRRGARAADPAHDARRLPRGPGGRRHRAVAADVAPAPRPDGAADPAGRRPAGAVAGRGRPADPGAGGRGRTDGRRRRRPASSRRRRPRATSRSTRRSRWSR